AVLEPGLTRRQAAAFLWPDSDEPNARQALRQQLLRLRRLCGTDLLGGEEAVRLDNQVSSDAAEAGTAPLLGAFDYGDLEQLAHWVETARERLQRDGAQRIERALGEAEAAGDHRTALGEAARLLALEPASERTYRPLMRLH